MDTILRCGSQTRLDMGLCGGPRGCELLGQSSDGGPREVQLTDRPGAQTCPGVYTDRFCSMKVAIWQVCLRHIQRLTVPSDLRRELGPERVDHLRRHAPVALCDHPVSRAVGNAITGIYIEYLGRLGASHSHQMEDVQTMSRSQ